MIFEILKICRKILFVIKKKVPKSLHFKDFFKILKSPYLDNMFQQVAKNIAGFLNFSIFQILANSSSG